MTNMALQYISTVTLSDFTVSSLEPVLRKEYQMLT